MRDIDSIMQELAEAPEYKNALVSFLEAIRQDEKMIEIMIGEWKSETEKRG